MILFFIISYIIVMFLVIFGVVPYLRASKRIDKYDQFPIIMLTIALPLGILVLTVLGIMELSERLYNSSLKYFDQKLNSPKTVDETKSTYRNISIK